MGELQTTQRTFLQKPEGKFGAVVTVGALGALAYGAFIMLPTIIILLSNTIYAVVLGVILFALLYVILDKRFRMLASYAYKGVMRTITGLFIQLNPIKILETYIEHLNEQLEDMGGHITKVNEQLSKLKGRIQKNEDDVEKCLQKASAAKTRGANYADQVALNAAQATRLQGSNVKLSELFNKLKNVYDVLLKVEKNAKFMLDDTTNEVETRKIDYLTIKEGYSAFKSAMSILKGNPDEMELFNRSMDFVVDDVRAKIGDMERFMQLSENTMKSIDLDNAVFQTKGFELIDAWEKNNSIVKETATKLDGKPKNKMSALF